MAQADVYRAGELARIEGRGVPAAKRPRRRWTIEEKLAVVAAAKASGDPVAVVARRHGMNANHLFGWLQQDRDGTLDRRALYTAPGGPLDFVEVGVVGGAAAAPAVNVLLPSGARVEIAAGADVAMVGAILMAVRAAS